MLDFSIGHYSMEFFLFGTALMMSFSILASKASSWIGVPSLLLFLVIGMVAGSEGPGGIEFNNYSLAFVIGSVSLIFILFDGGMGTEWKRVKPILKIGVSFSTLGVFFTCFVIGLFCYFAFSVSLMEGFLLGAIVSSTDAAAVFSVLRSKNLALRGSLKQILEFEAGSNDPMAILLTMGFLHQVMNPTSGVFEFLISFLLQTGIGVALGLLGGKATVWLFNNIKIDYEGLYAVFLVSLVLLIFSTTSILFGSGFMAVYVAGLVIGNSKILRKQTLATFQDGLAWIAQVTLFLVLGLLVYPSSLMEVWKEGVVLALFMMFVARPFSVYLSAPMARFDLRDRIFISWVGLRGAAPILLAILPWASQYPRAEYLFNLVFFVVLFSVFLQAPTIPWLASKLGISELMPKSQKMGENFLPKGFLTMELTVTKNGIAHDHKTIDLKLPVGVLLISHEREGHYSVPRGETVYKINDNVVALGRRSHLDTLRSIFGAGNIDE